MSRNNVKDGLTHEDVVEFSNFGTKGKHKQNIERDMHVSCKRERKGCIDVSTTVPGHFAR